MPADYPDPRPLRTYADPKPKPKPPKPGPLARKENILDLLTQDLHQRGVVGEDRTLKLLYLILTSRLLQRPVSAILKGPSSAGKSF